MKIVFGPVSSWRLGKSLGIDLISSEKKICSFDCIYCQLGKQPNKTIQRNNFISIEDLKKELSQVLQKITPDVVTFSGLGEPTLAKNMDLAIEAIKKITYISLAVLTNSSLLKIKMYKKHFLDLISLLQNLMLQMKSCFKR
jgi:wyosine [tRNA(Phe)-imidazoG37] synthetase (radical SAM superfamily)